MKQKKVKYITEKCTCVSGGLVEEMGRQLFPIKFYLFAYSTNFFHLLINLFANFLLLYRYTFFLTTKGKYCQKMEKKKSFICSLKLLFPNKIPLIYVPL